MSQKSIVNLLLSKLFRLRSSCNQNDQGFSLVEILVSVFVLSGFLLSFLQATVYAMFLHAQALDKQQAFNWLEQDLELIRYQAFILDAGSIDIASCANSTYGQRLESKISGGHPPNISITIDNKSYEIVRQYTPKDNHLEIVYQIDYGVDHPRYKGVGNDNQITSLSTEVFVNASLACPS